MIRSMSIVCVALVALFLVGAVNAGDDLLRLDGKGDAEVFETRGGGGGHGGGGHGGGFGGGHGFGGGGRGFGGMGHSVGVSRGYGGGFYGRGIGYGGVGYGGVGRGIGYGNYYRSGYGNYRPYYGFGYGLGLGLGLGYGYGGYGYGGYGYGGYGYGGYGYGNNYLSGDYYGSPAYYAPNYYSGGGQCTCGAPAASPSILIVPQPQGPQDSINGTFPYDGDPRQNDVAPGLNSAGFPNGFAVRRDGRLVSVPSPSSGYRFVAFGEPAAQPVERPASSNTLTVSYPAYGEPMPNFSDFSGGTTFFTAILR